MKVFHFLPLVLILAGCSSSDDPAAPAPKTSNPSKSSKEKFGDEVFKVPSYPGATPIPHSATEVDSAQSHGFNREYKTKDALDKVVTFYKTEGAKIGKLDENMSRDAAPGVKTVMIRRDNRDQLYVQVATMTDGSTKIILHYIIPKAGAKERMGGVAAAGG